TDEMQTDIARQRAREQPRLAKDLKAVANTQHWKAPRSGVDHFTHHGSEPRDRPCAQVVAVGEPAGHYHRVHTPEIGVGMPQTHRLCTDDARGAGRVHVVEGAGKGDDSDACGHDGSLQTVQSSITVLASRDSAIWA